MDITQTLSALTREEFFIFLEYLNATPNEHNRREWQYKQYTFSVQMRFVIIHTPFQQLRRLTFGAFGQLLLEQHENRLAVEEALNHIKALTAILKTP